MSTSSDPVHAELLLTLAKLDLEHQRYEKMRALAFELLKQLQFNPNLPGNREAIERAKEMLL